MTVDPAIEIQDVYEVVAAGAQPLRRDVRGTHPGVDVLVVEGVPGADGVLYRLMLAKATLTVTQVPRAGGGYAAEYAWSDLTEVFSLVNGLETEPTPADLDAALARIDEIVADGETYIGLLTAPLTLA